MYIIGISLTLAVTARFLAVAFGEDFSYLAMSAIYAGSMLAGIALQVERNAQIGERNQRGIERRSS